jgi:hypothetical protein
MNSTDMRAMLQASLENLAAGGASTQPPPALQAEQFTALMDRASMVSPQPSGPQADSLVSEIALSLENEYTRTFNDAFWFARHSPFMSITEMNTYNEYLAIEMANMQNNREEVMQVTKATQGAISTLVRQQ